MAPEGGKPPTPAMSPIEKLYRRFWHRKGDVFHLLLSLAISLDDRCAAAGGAAVPDALHATLW